MKKTILGIFFTVGIVSTAFASDNVKKEVSTPPETCTIITTVRLYDSCGKQIGSTLTVTGGTGSECGGSIDGLKASSVSVTVEGCKSTLLKSQKMTLNN